MAFTGHEEHQITFKEGSELTKTYRDQMNAGDRKGGYFSKDEILTLLDPSICVGIRFYYGIDEYGKQVMVLVGVKANEDDLIGEGYYCMEMSVPCPDQCGSDNILNS